MNDLIKALSELAEPIESDPDVWFERDWQSPFNVGKWREFICGSCKGIYRCENEEFQILAVIKTKSDNSFDRVLDWFENSCKREKYKLVFLEVGNPKLKQKLEYLGFVGTEKRMTKCFV